MTESAANWGPTFVALLLFLVNIILVPTIKYAYKRDNDEQDNKIKDHAILIKQVVDDQKEIKNNYLDRFEKLGNKMDKNHGAVMEKINALEVKIAGNSKI